MIAVVTVLAAFPLGYFLANRLAANMTYAVIYLWAFVFQGIYLMLDALDGGTNPAFVDLGVPARRTGWCALAIFVVGFGLVQLGHRLGGSRQPRSVPAVGSRAAH